MSASSPTALEPPALSGFRAMGCDVVVSGGDPATAAAVFERWEARFSRFRPDSELSRVNATPEPAPT